MGSADNANPCCVVWLGREHERERARLLNELEPPFFSSQPRWTVGAIINDSLHGLVEIADCDDPQVWIAWLVVEPRWRRCGLGTALFASAVSRAETCSDRTTLRLIFTRHQWPMRRLAMKANARLDLVLEELWADIRLRAPSLNRISISNGEHHD